MDAKNPHGHSISQPSPYDEINFDENVMLEIILKTPDDSDIGVFVEVDLIYPNNIKQKTNFPFSPEKENSPQDKFTPQKKKNKTISYTQAKKGTCDRTDKKITSLYGFKTL